MSTTGTTIVKLAADFAAGSITAKYIEENYGSGILSQVLALGGGVVAGGITNLLLESLDRETGIVSDVGSLVDDVLGLF